MPLPARDRCGHHSAYHLHHVPAAMTELGLLVLAATLSPGPNNLLLLQHGAAHGFRAGLPACLGIVAGGGAMLVVAWGVLTASGPAAGKAAPWLAAAGALVMLVMAAGMWQDRTPGTPDAAPPRFWTMALFQALNPKAWAFLASLGTLGVAGAGTGLGRTLLVFATVSLACSCLWLAAGGRLRRWLPGQRRQRLFNRGMAMVLAAMAVHLCVQAWSH